MSPRITAYRIASALFVGLCVVALLAAIAHIIGARTLISAAKHKSDRPQVHLVPSQPLFMKRRAPAETTGAAPSASPPPLSREEWKRALIEGGRQFCATYPDDPVCGAER